jgi:predicted MPP superfamily phosphohydrolase
VIVALLLFAAAFVGHVALLVSTHNWFYGQAFSKRTGDLFHLIHGTLAVVPPALLWWFQGLDLRDLFPADATDPVRLAVAGYVAVCWLTAFVLLPLNTLRRLLRPTPAALVESRSQVLDVAKKLGRPPLGTSQQRFLAGLPGNQVFEVELSERTLKLPRLPAAWDGLTILHLSDLHLCGTPDRDFYRVVMDRCNEWEPDLVAVTGDVADSFHHQKWIVPVLGRLRWRVAAFAILGNHDYYYDPPFIRRRLQRLGMHVLSNAWEQVEVRGEPLLVIGHEGPWLKPAPDLTKCPEGHFRLCLSHTPDNIKWARRLRIDLMLSGHVHGGQVRLPVFGSVLVPSVYGRRYDCGTFDEAPTLLHVSRGLSGEHPVRYLCRPEVTLLTLRCA